jgi:uncharacterized protein (TIGR03067 family)
MNAMIMLAASLALPVGVVGEDGKKEAERLQGVWKLTAMESRGRAFPVDQLGGAERYTLVVSGDAYVLSNHAGTLKAEPAQRHVDLTITEGRYKGNTVAGIYELTGDSLKLAIPSPARGSERPKELKGEAHTLYTFERDAKATKEQAAARLKELTGAVASQSRVGFPGGPADRRPASDPATLEMLRQIVERLDRIDKRLDALEKKGGPEEKK